MPNKSTAITFGKQISTLFDLGAMGAMPDRGLLDLFARGEEPSEAAFATLVERHGPMVLRVCRHVLADRHLAEDAFQVTFLLLARRARSIYDPDALAGWLHRVGRRVALRARAEILSRKHREGPQNGEADVAVAAADTLERDELCSLVHDEIDRLADAQRLPILLCAMQGLSHEEAAQRLRLPLGTVKSRLVRARKRLQRRLALRGLAPEHTQVPGVDDLRAGTAPVPLVLAVATTRAALQACPGTPSAAAPLSASIKLLLQEELTAMLAAKIKLAAGAAIAGAASIFIGISLAAPLFGRGQEFLPIDGKAQPRRAEASIASGKDRPSTRKADRFVGENTKAIPGGEQAPGIVAGAPLVAFRSAKQPIAVREAHGDIHVPERRLSAFGKDVQRAIQGGVQFLQSQQQPDGSWTDVENDAKTGVTSLAVLALLAAGERHDSPAIRKALELLRGFEPEALHSTYAISLQTMAFAAGDPERDRLHIAANVAWLERAQIKPGAGQLWTGSWTYANPKPKQNGDSSNTQYALLGLQAARDVGVPIDLSVVTLGSAYWQFCQQRDGGWTYTPQSKATSASMTCAGISSLAASRASIGQSHDQEFLLDDTIHNCGAGGVDRTLQRGTDWLASHFSVDQNFGSGRQWRFYYLYGLERAGRLTGKRFFGEHDWYRDGAEALVREQEKQSGAWAGQLVETNKVLATSFALLFLGKGRAPVLINKLRHGPDRDWDNDPDDVSNLVGIVSNDWKHLLTWQTVDSAKATVSDLLRAPILFLNGHKAPALAPAERQNLRAYVEAGGVIFAEACCGSTDFDMGFRRLMNELFPEQDDALRPLPDNHPIWRSRHQLAPQTHPVFGIPRGFRTAVIYSPKDLSCYWNQSQRAPTNPAVIKAIKLGQNVIDYVTGRELPPDKLSER